MCKCVKSFWRDDDGATAIEYGLIAALIVLGAMTGIHAFASSAINMYQYIQKSVESVI